MNNSKLGQQAVESAQLIASALPKLDKPDIAAKNHSFSRADIPRLKTCSSFDMTVKGAWRARRDLYRSLSLTPTGRISFAAADLYEDILDLWQSENRIQNFNHRDGCYYWGRPIAMWAKKYKCTEAQFDAWLKILRDRGLIATCMMKTKTNMLQIRPLVADGSACLSGWPDAPNFAHLLKAETLTGIGSAGSFPPNALAPISSQCIGGNFLPHKDLGLPVGVACTGLKDFVDASLSTEASTGNSTNESGTINPKNQTPILPESILKVPKFCTASTRNSAGLLWESLVAQYQPEHRAPLAVRDFRNLRTVFEKIDSMTDLPGHEQVLRWGIRNWVLWARPIGYEHQVNVNAVVTRLDTLLAAYREERNRLAEKAAYATEMAAASAAYLANLEAEIEQAKVQKAEAPQAKKGNSFQALVQTKQAANQPAMPVQQVVMTVDTNEVSQPVTEAVSTPECPALVLANQVSYADEDADEGYTHQDWLDAAKVVGLMALNASQTVT